MTSNLLKGATLIVTFAAGFFASWYLFMLMYSPTDHDFLVTTTSHYFKHMSDVEKLQYASYRDCKLEKPSANEIAGGIAMLGVCTPKDKNQIGYTIGLNVTGKFEYNISD